MSDLILWVTWFFIFLIVYHHAIYPILLKIIHRVKSKPLPIKRLLENSELPEMTVILPAYNEQGYVADKLRNLSIMAYESSKLKIILACDGCTDDTAEIARKTLLEPECQHLNVEIRGYQENRGKVAVINDVMTSVDTELVAMSDISALCSMDALLIAATDLSHDKIGAVTGHYQLLKPGSVGERAYWQYQSSLKRSEASLGSTMGAHGAFYVFKRELFEPLEADTINDDFILPMRIVAQGYDAIYEPLINALEQEQASQNQDSQRRKRISSGNMQQLIRLRHLLSPRYKGVAFTFFSGKTLRVVMPYLLLIVLINSLFLAMNSWFWLAISIIQLFIYGLVAWIQLSKQQPKGLLQTLHYLVMGHFSNLIGATRYLLGKEKGRWQRVSH